MLGCVLLPLGIGTAAAATGEQLFVKQCGVCHTVDASAPPRQGPHLVGIIGRTAGKMPKANYSKGMKAARFTWDRDHLDKWLAEPQAVIPDTTMMYRQNDPAIRAAIIEYLASIHH
jgi:cytochrome c